MKLDLSEQCLNEILKSLSLKAITGINPEAANIALQEVQNSIRQSQSPPMPPKPRGSPKRTPEPPK